jgi:23S rRNA pseudouridine2605 synthase
MFELIGHSVLKLRRTHIGFLSEDNLKPGRWRLLSPTEVKRLMSAKTQKNDSHAKAQRRKKNL